MSQVTRFLHFDPNNVTDLAVELARDKDGVVVLDKFRSYQRLAFDSLLRAYELIVEHTGGSFQVTEEEVEL